MNVRLRIPGTTRDDIKTNFEPSASTDAFVVIMETGVVPPRTSLFSSDLSEMDGGDPLLTIKFAGELRSAWI